MYVYMHVTTIYEEEDINFKVSKEGRREERGKENDVITL